MPCESCNAQFTVFKRKKSCAECRRLYCTECLNKRRNRILCERCVIFTSRPLSKIELLKLKPKDLIFYLQSKHISTSGCVEKEELVNLILIHVNNSSNYAAQDTESNYSNNETSENSGNTFDHLKQTCQNLFSSFTEKISTDFVFDSRASYNQTNDIPLSNEQQKSTHHQNIFTQPRATASTASTSTTSTTIPILQQQQQQQNRKTHTTRNSDGISNEFDVFQCTTISTTTCRLSSQSSEPNSPVFSVNSIISSTSTELSNVSQLQQQQQQQQQQYPQQNEFRSMLNTGYRIDNPQKISTKNNNTNNMPTVHNQYKKRPQQQHQQQQQINNPHLLLLSSKEPIDVNYASGCECSDDETILYFQNEFKNDNFISNHNINGAGPSTGHSSKLAAATPSNNNNNITKLIESSLSSNDGSSFEDITLAITTNTINDYNCSGGSNTGEKINKSGSNTNTAITTTTTTTTTTTNDSDSNWQFINKNPVTSSSPSSGTSTSFINIPIDIDVAVICDADNDHNENEDVNVASVTSVTTITTAGAAATASTNTDPHRIKNNDNVECGPSKSSNSNLSNNNTFQQLNHSQKIRRLIRHRSDGYVTTIKNSKSIKSSSDDDDDDDDDDEKDDVQHRGNANEHTNNDISIILDNQRQGTSHSKRSKRSCCDKCGKSKRNLRKSIDKFRRQLEMENVSESEIKAKLNAFLIYLDERSIKSQLSDESESIANVLSSPDIDDQHLTHRRTGSITITATDNPQQNATIMNAYHRDDDDDDDILIEDVLDDVDDVNNYRMSSSVTENQQNTTIDIDDDDDVDDDNDNNNIFYPYNENDGINVYGSDANSNAQQQSQINSRQFLNIADFQTDSDLQELNVKQLKEILMLNRIDFKGCCEKTELLERVKRLWDEHNACPNVEKLPLDDLCKICMDAPIECVILECGHMATCTNCGKVLSECPICRQYIVRVVRFFRA